MERNAHCAPALPRSASRLRPRRSGPVAGAHPIGDHAAAAAAEQPSLPPTPERARLLLLQWRRRLSLSARERSLLGAELAGLDRQLQRLQTRRARVVVFGRVGVGKSSLLNALLGEAAFATDLAHGCTRHQASRAWDQMITGLAGVDLVDTPGLDEIAAPARARLAARLALAADLVLLVIDADLAEPERQALAVLLASGKPLLLVLNRCDCWPPAELPSLLASVRRRLPPDARQLAPIAVAAAPRRPIQLPDGRVRSETQAPRIAPLRRELIECLERDGALMLALNALRAGDRFSRRLHATRLQLGRSQAQGLIGQYAAAKATGVALNPLPLLDLLGGMACDTALVLHLSQLYDLRLDPPAARALLGRVSGQNALIGGSQLALQALLAGLRQLLLLAAPLSGGLSLAPAAPVALAQAALAVQTTRRTGMLVARELLRGAAAAGRPGALLRRLAEQDPQARHWLQHWRLQDPSGTGPARSGLLP